MADFLPEFTSGTVGVTESRSRGNAWMWIGIVVIALLIGGGVWYYMNEKKKKSGSGSGNGNGTQSRRKSKGRGRLHTKRAPAADPRAQLGDFQPPPVELKQQFESDRVNAQKVESLQADSLQRYAGIQQLGLSEVECSADKYALGPDAGNTKRTELKTLLPNAWRKPEDKTAEYSDTEDMDISWAKHAPNVEGFKTFIRASSSVRHGDTDHIINPSGRINHIGQPPFPSSRTQHLFNDSSVRQDIIAETVGDLDDPFISCL